MLVLTRRLFEKIVFPGFHTSVQVTALHPGGVRLGVDAPPDVRVLTEEAAARGVRSPDAEDTPTLLQVNCLLQNRLEIARLGLGELRSRVRAGERAAAEVLLDKLDEDLGLLQRRMYSTVERATPRRPRRTSRPRREDRLPRLPR
jgi:sRNA-binding carbon storage regulator CsrA